MIFLRSRIVTVAVSWGLLGVPVLAQVGPEPVLIHELLADDGPTVRRFARSLDLGGSVAVVGSWVRYGPGSAHVFDVETGRQVAPLSSEIDDWNDKFGWAVATNGTVAMVGAPGDRGQGVGSGAAYLFDAGTGELLWKLVPSQATRSQGYGYCVSVSEDYAYVGYSGYISTGYGSPEYAGVFVFDINTGEELRVLKSGYISLARQFGVSVASHGTNALVGTKFETVYLFDGATGSLLRIFQPSDTQPDDRFGEAVDLGETLAVVGAPGDDDQGAESGSAYVFDLATGQQLHKLLPQDGVAGDEFGVSVALYENTVVVGTTVARDGASSSGAAYVFDANSGAQLAKIFPAKDFYGNDGWHGVAMNDSAFIIASYTDTDGYYSAGTVYTYDTTDYQQLLNLQPHYPYLGDEFGVAVAAIGGHVVVGSDEEKTASSQTQGAAYVFDPSTGQHRFKLSERDGYIRAGFGSEVSIDPGSDSVLVGAKGYMSSLSRGYAYIYDLATGELRHNLFKENPKAVAHFGHAVAIHSGVAAVSNKPGYELDSRFLAVGEPSVFLFNAETGALLDELVAPPSSFYSSFGESLARLGPLTLIGEPDHDSPGSNAGCAYLHDQGTGTLTRLTLPDAALGDRAGSAVALTQTLAIVGSPKDDDLGTSSGSVSVLDLVTGARVRKIIPADGGAGDRFGEILAADGDRLAVGVPGDNLWGPQSGAVYIFDLRTGVQRAKLTLAQGAAGDRFGASVAITGNRLVVGAMGEDTQGENSGSAYVYILCPADLNNDGFVDSGDIGNFVNLFLAADSAVDFNHDGFIDSGDITSFVSLYLAGC